MAGMTEVVTAPTRTELQKQVQQWTKTARDAGMEIELGYDPDRVEKTEDGWAILIRAHS